MSTYLAEEALALPAAEVEMLRVDGAAHLAEDVAQQVFTDLARKARQLRAGAVEVCR